MSYLVLARKWRPQTFEEVVGQEHITRTLARAIDNGRIAHAYLFAGPRGVGKTTTARIIAKALNCQSSDGPTSHPCNRCTSCVEITEGRSPDVLEIDGASHRGIEDARELQTNIQYAPVGRYKVVIIDEVHMLTREAFNALLKTLEEPPSNVVFVFATTEPDKVPLTIISRCQRFDFRRVPPKLIAEHIKKIAKSEGFEITDEAADFIALRADGAVRDALSMLDQIFAYQPEKIDIDTVMALLGVVPVQAFQKIALTVGSKDPAAALTELEKLIETGIDPIQIARGLMEHFRNALIAKTGALDRDFPNYALYDQIAQKFSLQDLLRIMRVVSDGYSRVRRSDTPRYVLEEMLIYLALLDQVKDIAELLRLARSGEGAPAMRESTEPKKSGTLFGSSKTEQAKSAPEPRHIEIPQEINPAQLPEEPSERFLAVLAEFHKPMAAVLRRTEITLDESRLIIKFTEGMESVREELLANSEQMELVRRAAILAFGPDTTVELLKSSSSGSEPSKQQSTNAAVPPEIGQILNLFDAKLEE